MNQLTRNLIRRALEPSVTNGAPGEMQLRFSLLRLLPDNMRGYLHYLENVLTMLPGVISAPLNASRTGADIRYDPSRTAPGIILDWYRKFLEEGMDCLSSPAFQHMREEEIVSALTERMQRHLPSP